MAPKALRLYKIPHSLLQSQRQALRSTNSRPALHPRPHNINPQSLRHASASTLTQLNTSLLVTRLKNLFYGASLALFLSFSYLYITDTRAGIHQWLVVPSLRWFYTDAEEAHEAGNKALKALHSFGLHPRERGNPDALGDLRVEVFGHTLDNPIATSAGIDKHAEIPSPLLALGPAIVEIGGATPYPQDGNPRPRVFRIPSQKALINRYGLNSEGAETVAMRLRQRVREFAYAMGFGIDEEAERMVLDGEAGVPPGSLTEGKLLAVQVAKNKFTPEQDVEAVKRDYVYCVNELARYADIIVVNVSSPNTPGLRTLQKAGPLTDILKSVVDAAKSVRRTTKPAVMVKVSPDEESDEQIAGVCEAVWESGVDGVIVGNTTKKRPQPLPQGYVLPAKEATLILEEGGYSGPQMFERTLELVKRYRKMLDRGPKGASPATTEVDRPVSVSDDARPKRATPETTDVDKSASVPAGPDEALVDKVEGDTASLKDPSTQSNPPASDPPFQLPERNLLFSAAPDDLSQTGSAIPTPTPMDHDNQPASPTPTPIDHASHPDQSPSTVPSPSPTTPRKIIFATGGITNGAQALEILNAGASVAMVYTALVYGGVGTISRIKEEMRTEKRRRGEMKGEVRDLRLP